MASELITNLWFEIGNSCLLIADRLLKQDTTPTAATVGVVRKLTEIAISIDQNNLRWAHENQFGSVAFLDQPFSRQPREN